MNRLLLFAAVLLSAVQPLLAAAPNVILILADDMAVGDISAFNGRITRTPDLDRLIQGGLWFDRAYSAAPVCAPARASLLTGRYPHRTGVVSLDLNTEPELTRLLADETTLAQVFAANGYHTGLVGKWHIGLGQGYGPIARGFQEFEGFQGSSQTAYFDYAIQTDDAMAEPKRPQDQYLTDALSERAVAFVRRHAADPEPFFLHLAHYAPHRPIQAPEAAIKPYRDAGLNEETATIYAMIEIMDRGIGELMRELDALGIRERTLIVFASDNGPDVLVPKRFNAGLRGGKYTVYEGGIRVPLILNWPSRIAPGRRNEPVHFADVLPTLVELCSLRHKRARKLDGASFAALVTGSGRFEPPARFWQWNRHSPNYTHNAAVRDGDWKLVRPFVTRGPVESDSTERVALYHLGRDPQEAVDLAAKHPKRVEAMHDALDRWTRDVELDRRR